MTRIFLTGASGYIGGEVLHVLRDNHPQYDISVLVRDSSKGEKISRACPNVRIVLGELDSAPLIEEEARNADIVVHAASSNHIRSAEAIARGLMDGNRATSGHWIQVSGATLLSAPEIEKGSFGEPSDKTYSDVDDAQEIRDLIHRYSTKRVSDSFILGLAGAPRAPRTAIVFPPTIYGRGRGPVNQRSVQVPELARVTLQNGTGIHVGRGLSAWSNVHITDISQIFLKLVEKAVAGKNDSHYWNENGLYFAENGAMAFRDLALLATQEAYNLGLLKSASSVKEINHQEADALSPHGGVLWGTNAQEKAQRARKYLNWTPTGNSLNKEVPETVAAEASRLGFV